MLSRMFLRWALLTAALYVTVYLGDILGLPIKVDSPIKLFFAALALGFANAIIAPILKNIACVLNCLTLGLLGFFINVFLFWVVGNMNLGFHVTGWIASIYGSVVSGLLSTAFSTFIPEPTEKE